MPKNGLFIFRRDLRIVDNSALNLLSGCSRVYTIFIFTSEQVKKNKFKNRNAVHFMIESLEDLAGNIRRAGGKLHTFYGDNEAVIRTCITAFNIDAVAFNTDITAYAKKRDASIIKLCRTLGVSTLTCSDYYLHDFDKIVSSSGDHYKKFSPYYSKAKRLRVADPTTKRVKFATGTNDNSKIGLNAALAKFARGVSSRILSRMISRILSGGRHAAIAAMSTASKQTYCHDDLSKETSKLSAYIKFGCISIREVYKKFKSVRKFIRQLYWRDFYAQLLYYNPYVLHGAMRTAYKRLRWENNARWFNAWCAGKTGFPVVDAGMRELNTTGYMHNRARLITCCFLIKTLLIDWRKGEKYFASMLTDYDPASNNGNFQWVASTGADSQPYFRIFNPWRQSKKCDPQCLYIKKYIPELADVPPRDIHNWDTMHSKYDVYITPICDYEKQTKKALKMYRAIRV